ncbi:MAG: cbb3-type cytochrome c oxidase subunit 3 [Phycisphaerae bacterium]|nr:cbb3-type cytochrome c oxidase subunit 3 [Phycisphaerae bacterium]
MSAAYLLAETSFGAIASLLIFFAMFIGIVVWILVAGRSGRWARDARIPLDDDKPVTPRSTDSQGTKR